MRRFRTGSWTLAEITITGANLNVVNGLGATDTTNALGNLVIGYNADLGDVRTGSHMMVVGDLHSYTSFGGIIVGFNNEASGGWSSVTGGLGNKASGILSSVSGGAGNIASGNNSTVSGGFNNKASGNNSSVTHGCSRSAATFCGGP